MCDEIRPFEESDETAVLELWYRAGREAYVFLPSWQTLSLESAHVIFFEEILPGCELWVATHGSQIVGYLALKGSYIDRLYVDPSAQRKGWGTRLLNYVKTVQQCGLELHTHQQNNQARAFYEKHGFRAVKFGTSPPPESAPDVEYHWRPMRRCY